MEIYKAEICIGGLLTNTVVKEDLTASEIVILRRIHGDDAIKGIKLVGRENREYQKEYERLIRRFGRRKVEDAFPGARPVLPQNLKDIGMIVSQEGGYINNEVIAKGPNNLNRKSKREQELEDLGIEGTDKNDEDEGKA